MELLAGQSIPILEIMRSIDASQLELVKQLEFEQLKMRMFKLYGIEIESMVPSKSGAGSLTYFVNVSDLKFVVKYPSENEMNHSEVEIKVCKELLEKGIPACKFVKNNQGNYLSIDENGRRFTVQEFYEGETYAYNEAPIEAQTDSAIALANIHNAMKDMTDIPIGIGADFFKYRKPEYMIDSYKETLQHAIQNQDNIIAEKIRNNIKVIESMPRYSFDTEKFSCGNTHGDYMISQILWKDKKINGIIDWTCACKHPYIWEIIRSYVFMAPEVKLGEINIENLINYISTYLKHGTLNEYDIKNAGNLFFYFLAVCNFYGQYFDSISNNRNIYLEQANMSANLINWFDKHLDELNKSLEKLANQI